MIAGLLARKLSGRTRNVTLKDCLFVVEGFSVFVFKYLYTRLFKFFLNLLYIRVRKDGPKYRGFYFSWG